MAQSFQHVSVAIDEAERMNWKDKDYQIHNKAGWKVNKDRNFLNRVLVKANGKTSKAVVNNYLTNEMLDSNRLMLAKQQKRLKDKFGDKWHTELDMRNFYPVGKFKKIGKKKTAYDLLKSRINAGNKKRQMAKDENGGGQLSSQNRDDVLQQYIIGIGDEQEWKIGSRKILLNNLKDSFSDQQQLIADSLTNNVFKPILKRFEEENPSMHVVQAVVQFDESHPHMHVTVLPYQKKKPTKTGQLRIGSTEFVKNIQADHPEFDDKSTAINKWFENNHLMVRDVIENADLHLLDNEQHSLTLPLGKRKGTHEKSVAPNIFNSKQEQIKQQHQLDEQQRRIQQQLIQQKIDEEDVKKEHVDLIKTLEPETTVNEQYKLNNNVKPNKIPDDWNAPVSSDSGFKAFMKQSLKWLKQTIRNVTNRFKQRKQQIAKREDNLDNSVKSQSDKIVAVLDASREQMYGELRKKQVSFSKSVNERTNEIFKYGIKFACAKTDQEKEEAFNKGHYEVNKQAIPKEEDRTRLASHNLRHSFNTEEGKKDVQRQVQRNISKQDDEPEL